MDRKRAGALRAAPAVVGLEAAVERGRRGRRHEPGPGAVGGRAGGAQDHDQEAAAAQAGPLPLAAGARAVDPPMAVEVGGEIHFQRAGPLEVDAGLDPRDGADPVPPRGGDAGLGGAAVPAAAPWDGERQAGQGGEGELPHAAIVSGGDSSRTGIEAGGGRLSSWRATGGLTKGGRGGILLLSSGLYSLRTRERVGRGGFDIEVTSVPRGPAGRLE